MPTAWRSITTVCHNYKMRSNQHETHSRPDFHHPLFCLQQEHQEQKQNKKTEPTLDIQAELAAIEEMRTAFEETIKAKRYEDIPRFVTSDIVTVGPGSTYIEEKILPV